MFKIEGTKIAISRGDTKSFTVTFKNDVPPDGTIARVSMQKTISKDPNLWSKDIPVSGGAVTIDISSSDSNYPFGEYVWDLRLLYQDGNIYTPINPSPFIIKGVVGDV